MADWDKNNIHVEFLQLLFHWGFANHETQRKAFDQMWQIEEFREGWRYPVKEDS